MILRHKDMGWDDIKEAREELASYELVVGVLGDAAIREHPEGDRTIAELAFLNEYGSDDGVIPERGAHRLAFNINQAELEKRMARTPALVDKGRLGPKQGLDLIGLWYADKVKDEIRSFDDPENAPATVDIKGFDNPLIHTGRTINSVMHETRGKFSGPNE